VRALFLALPMLFWAVPAAAEVSGNVGLVSDYRYRGLSLSRGHPALQGEVLLEHASGLYADLWVSTLGHGTETEFQLGGGYSTDLSDHLSIDLSGNYYLYPGAASDNYAEATAQASLTEGHASASFGVSYAPAQRGTGDEDNVYLFGMADYAVPKTRVKLLAGLGYERGAFDEVASGGKWDWTLGAELEAKPATLGLAYVGSNADGGDRHALVASVLFSF
jgi:uncharacterized protein (TIGR02001 family)